MCCYSTAGQLDDRFGAKAVESELAQGPDRRGCAPSFAITPALGKAVGLCACLNAPQVGRLELSVQPSGILLL